MGNPIGHDLRKWYITKSKTCGLWAICPPVTDKPGWSSKGGLFDTGAEAHAAFSGKRASR